MRIKNFKIFNEELQSGTYYSASNKLKDIGHDRRSGEIRKWAETVQAREKEERTRVRLSSMKNFDPFEMTIYSCRWDRTSNTTIEDYLMDGSFYIEPSFPYDWFSDMMSDWKYDSYSSSLWLPIELGISPANEETSIKLKEIENKLSDCEWDSIYWMDRIMIEVIPDGHDSVIDSGKAVVETRESDLALFSNRKDAIRFKNLLVDAIEGKNTFGQNQWYPKGISSAFERFFENERKYTQERINAHKELLYSAQWYEPGYNDDTKEVPLSWFTTKRGYSKEDIKGIANLKVGETWYSDDHDATAIKCDDIEKVLPVKESDVPKIVNSIKKMSVNKLYRN